MRPDKAILTALARQMYEDIRFNAANAPTMAVDEDTTRLFNILLRQTREAYPRLGVLEGFSDIVPRTIKFKDALVVAGQLQTILTYQLEGAAPARTEKSFGPTPVGMHSSSSSLPKLSKPLGSSETVRTPYDTESDRTPTSAEGFEAELYGPNPPKRLNADGTVPFSLEEDE